MAEEFLTLMADLDDDSQQTLSAWYEELKKAGFTGNQTPGLPFHISMGCFSVDKEAAVIGEMKELAARFASIPVHISHIGLFAGGKVLYAAPDMNPADLLNLRHAIQTETQEAFPWTPHCTIIIDEAETIQRALPILLRHFQPFVGRITKLHLCAFWPTREIATVFLENDSICIKLAETDEELCGRGYVHCTSWQEAYRGIVCDRYLDTMTVEATTARARKFPENTLVAKDKEKVVGFAVYGSSRDEDLPDAGEIEAIYVLPEYYGRKVGYRLMNEAISRLKGHHTIFLWVLEKNERAISFYRKYGFEFDGSKKEWKLGTPVSIVRMIMKKEKRL